MSKARRASHAGSWYTERGKDLDEELSGWLNLAEKTQGSAQAIIAPHAGYTYSGETAAFAYKHIDPAMIRRVFILGPSHHFHLSGCALTTANIYKTPLYDLTIDRQVCDELYSEGSFDWMSSQTDEDEHSIEMHLPYLAKVMQSKQNQFTVVPVLVGSLSFDSELKYGKIFAKYLAQKQNLFIVSSDFCHWGQRFKYTFYKKEDGEIWNSIENLDRQGMTLVEKLDHVGFSSYIKQTHNTICGRHPIAVLLAALDVLKSSLPVGLKFVRYAQSSKCRSQRDSSVSYASAVVNISL